jgi:hypothetical protein
VDKKPKGLSSLKTMKIAFACGQCVKPGVSRLFRGLARGGKMVVTHCFEKDNTKYGKMEKAQRGDGWFFEKRKNFAAKSLFIMVLQRRFLCKNLHGVK